MNAETGSRRRQYAMLAAVALATVGAVFLGIGFAAQAPAPPTPPSPTVPQQPAPAPPAGDTGGHGAHATATSPAGRPARAHVVEGLAGPSLPVSEPRRIRIPKLDVASSLEQLRRDKDGRMTVPQDPGSAGWYTGGPTPGAPGPAVIAGHVTWDRKPAVFFDLAELRPGDRIDVDRADGTTAVFRVSRLGEYDKAKFPTDQVYGSIDHAGLRLITCGGEYDDRRHRYNSNVVVFATLARA